MCQGTQAASSRWKRQGNRFSPRASRISSAPSTCSGLLTSRTLREYICVALSHLICDTLFQKQQEIGTPTMAWLSHQHLVTKLLLCAPYIRNDSINRSNVSYVLSIARGPLSHVLFTTVLRSREIYCLFSNGRGRPRTKSATHLPMPGLGPGAQGFLSVLFTCRPRTKSATHLPTHARSGSRSPGIFVCLVH